MEKVYPAYYPEFKCIAGGCRHSCCIGWEIDIDPETLALYRGLEGPLGDRLRRNITGGESPCFALGDGERCPFLNRENLCDIILERGEQALCHICREHPRFHNHYPGRVESGLGLCCEAAGRLILGWSEPAKLCVTGEWEEYDELLELRDEVIALLQDRSLPPKDRAVRALALCGAAAPEKTASQWADALLALERLEQSWTDKLTLLRRRAPNDFTPGHRAGIWEQLAVYFVYRHLANARDEADLAARAAFAVLAAELILAVDDLCPQEGEVLPVEAARQFSAEVEYSEENMEQLLDLLSRPWPQGAFLAED